MSDIIGSFYVPERMDGVHTVKKASLTLPRADWESLEDFEDVPGDWPNGDVHAATNEIEGYAYSLPFLAYVPWPRDHCEFAVVGAESGTVVKVEDWRYGDSKSRSIVMTYKDELKPGRYRLVVRGAMSEGSRDVDKSVSHAPSDWIDIDGSSSKACEHELAVLGAVNLNDLVSEQLLSYIQVTAEVCAETLEGPSWSDSVSTLLRKFQERDSNFPPGSHKTREEAFALASLSEVLILVGLKQDEAAIAACGRLFKNAPGKRRNAMASLASSSLLLLRAALQLKCSRAKEAVATYHAAIGQLESAPGGCTSGEVAMALVLVGNASRWGAEEGASLAAFREVAKRFGDSTDDASLPWVGMALVNAALDIARPWYLGVPFLVGGRFTRLSTGPMGWAVRDVTMDMLDSTRTGPRVIARLDESLIYDSIAQDFGDTRDRWKLQSSAKSVALYGNGEDMTGAVEEAIGLLDEVIALGKRADDHELVEWIASAFALRGFFLEALGKHDEALNAYEEVVERFSEETSYACGQWVAMAGFNTAVILQEAHKYEAALVKFDEVIKYCMWRFSSYDVPKDVRLGEGDTEGIGIFKDAGRYFVDDHWPLGSMRWEAYARCRKADILRLLDRPQEALLAYDSIVHRFSRVGSGSDLYAERAKALYGEGLALGDEGQFERGVAFLNEFLGRFEKEQRYDIKETVAHVLCLRIAFCYRLGRIEESLDTCQRAIRLVRLSSGQSIGLSQVVRSALVLQAQILEETGRYAESIEVYKVMASCFGLASATTLQRETALILFKQGSAWAARHKPAEALKMFQMLVEEYDANPSMDIQRISARARYGAVLALDELGQADQALIVCGAIVSHYSGLKVPEVSLVIARSLLYRAVMLEGRQDHVRAIQSIDELIRHFSDSDDTAIQQEVRDALVTRESILEHWSAKRHRSPQ